MNDNESERAMLLREIAHLKSKLRIAGKIIMLYHRSANIKRKYRNKPYHEKNN